MTSRRRISQLPFRQRLAVCLLYLIALGLVFAGITISFLHGSGLGMGFGLFLEALLLISLVRRALSCNHHPAAARAGAGILSPTPGGSRLRHVAAGC